MRSKLYSIDKKGLRVLDRLQSSLYLSVCKLKKPFLLSRTLKVFIDEENFLLHRWKHVTCIAVCSFTAIEHEIRIWAQKTIIKLLVFTSSFSFEMPHGHGSTLYVQRTWPVKPWFSIRAVVKLFYIIEEPIFNIYKKVIRW